MKQNVLDLKLSLKKTRRREFVGWWWSCTRSSALSKNTPRHGPTAARRAN